MIRNEKRLAGLIQYLITHADFLNVEIEQVVVALARGTADHGQFRHGRDEICWMLCSVFFVFRAPPGKTPKHASTPE